MVTHVPLRAAVAIVPAGILYLAVMLLGYALLRPISDNIAYPAYIESLALDPGDVGAEPVETTPEARSLADLESMDTFYVIGKFYPSNVFTLDNRHYYSIILKSGERVLALINFDHAEELDDSWRRLPVGQWVPLKLSKDGAKTLSYYSSATDREDYYIDMVGDFGRIYTEEEYMDRSPAYRVLSAVEILFFWASWYAFWRFFKKKNWF